MMPSGRSALVSRNSRLSLADCEIGVPAAAVILYDSYMSDVAVSEARNELAEIIDEARRSREPVYVTRRGRRVAVILDADLCDQIIEDAEDASDRRELAVAREEDDYVPWDEVKADLGLE